MTVHKEDKLKDKNESKILKRIDNFLKEWQKCGFKNIFRAKRLNWKLIKEYYSIRKILKRNFKLNTELKGYIKILPLNVWLTFHYIFETAIVLIAGLLFYFFFWILPIFKGVVAFYVSLVIAIAYFLNEYLGKVHDDMVYSLSKMLNCKKQNNP